jgi:hypothetical protein
MDWCRREPTIAEILSDSIVRSLMRADGVDPNELGAMLKRMAGAQTRNRWKRLRVGPTLPRKMEHEAL